MTKTKLTICTAKRNGEDPGNKTHEQSVAGRKMTPLDGHSRRQSSEASARALTFIYLTVPRLL